MDYLRWSEAVTPAMSPLPSHTTAPGQTGQAAVALWSGCSVAFALVRAGRLWTSVFVALRSSGIPGARDRLPAEALMGCALSADPMRSWRRVLKSCLGLYGDRGAVRQ
jgi:hypothetical protein